MDAIDDQPGKKTVIVERSGTTGRLYLDSTTPALTWTVPATAIADGTTYLGAADVPGSGAYYDGAIHEVVIAKDTVAGDAAALLTYLLTV